MFTNPWVPFIVGIIVGAVLECLIYLSRSTVGTLKIDHTSSEKDIYRIEINDLEELSHRSRIVLKVDNDADLSHE